MINLIQIKENTKLSALLTYKEIPLKNLTILAGPNGIGKSSILQGIDNHVKQHDSGYYGSCGKAMELVISENENVYETLLARTDNGKYRGYFSDNIALDITSMFQSEGQSTMTSFYNKLKAVDSHIDKKTTKDIVFLIDELDSGVSFDNILKIINIIEVILKKFPQVQIIMTAHNYEFFRVFKDNVFCIDFGKYVDLSDYKNYRSYYYTHLIFEKAKKEKEKQKKKEE